MTIKINDKLIEFDKIELIIQKRNIENVFKDNKRTLRYKLDKAINNSKNYLHKIAFDQKIKYKDYLDLNFGEFLMKLKKREKIVVMILPWPKILIRSFMQKPLLN